MIAVCDRGKVRVLGFGIRFLMKSWLCVLQEVENGEFLAHPQIRNIGIPKLNSVD